MEVSLSLCLIVLSALAAIWFLKLSVSDRRRKPKKRLPPAPWTLPIIGSLHHIIGAPAHQGMTQLCRRHGPVVLLRLGEVPTVIVSSTEGAALVLKDNDLVFGDRPPTTIQDVVCDRGMAIAFAPYGDQWRQMRKLCIVELLSAKQVKRMEGIRAEEVGNLLRAITSSSSSPTDTGGASGVNVRKALSALSSSIVSRAVFGGKFRQQDEFLQELATVFRLIGSFCLVDLFPSSRLVRWLSNSERQMARSYDRILQFVAGIIDERKAARAAGYGASCSAADEDLLDVLLRLQREDSFEFPLTAETIGALLFDLFSAGMETTATLLEWALSELVSHSEVMAKAQFEIRMKLGCDRDVIANKELAEIHYTRMVIKEALRLHPPGPILGRRCRKDCKFMGYDLPKDANVFINVFAISRDPKYWKNPEEFIPERFETNNIDYNGTNFEFTPFGAGRRQCPGIQFGSSVVEIALTNLLYHFDWKLLDGEVGLDMSEQVGMIVNKKYNLQLQAIPHVLVKDMPSK